MKCVEGDRDKPDWPTARHRDKHIPFFVRARGSNRVSLTHLPVWMQAQEDVIA
jgi:hypothetical protein